MDSAVPATKSRTPIYKLLYAQVLFAIALGAIFGWLAPHVAAADWVKARIALERGKLADLQGRRQDATQAYRAAIPLSITGNDDDTRAEANRLLRTPFK